MTMPTLCTESRRLQTNLINCLVVFVVTMQAKMVVALNQTMKIELNVVYSGYCEKHSEGGSS